MWPVTPQAHMEQVPSTGGTWEMDWATHRMDRWTIGVHGWWPGQHPHYNHSCRLQAVVKRGSAIPINIGWPPVGEPCSGQGVTPHRQQMVGWDL